MSGNTYTVQPGAPQQFSGSNIPKNSVIVNTSSRGSIWISSEQYVAPGIGIELNPAASVTWTGKQLWACLDPNAVDIFNNPAPVTFSVSDDISNINDPVAVAEALIVQGVPNVFIQENVFTGIVPASGGQVFIADITKYASLVIGATRELPTSHNGFIVDYTFFDEPAENVTGQGTLTAPGKIINAGPGISARLPPYVIPVTGNSVSITNNSIDDISIFIDGTNRLISRTELVQDSLGIVSFVLGPQAFVAGTQYLFGICFPPRGDNVVTIECGFVDDTTLTGYFSLDPGLGAYYTPGDPSYPGINVIDSTELAVQANGDKILAKTVKFPQTEMLLTFGCVVDDPGPCYVFFRVMG